MTITPTAAAGVLPVGVIDPAGASAIAVPGDFLALVQQALAEALGTAPADPAAPQEDGEAATAPAGDPLLAALAAGVTIGPAPVPVGAADPAPVSAVTGAPEHANVTPGAVVTDSRTGSDIRMFGDAPASAPSAPTTPTTNAPAAAESTDVAAVRGARLDGDGAGQSATDSGAGGDDRPATPNTGTSAAPATSAAPTSSVLVDQPATASLSVVSAATPPTVTTSSTAAGASTPVQHVTGQVFPEVTSLVSRGDGAHRITLTLNPEALGEVRVVMTVRDGAVHVRLAAGHEARQALIEGSPELTRLLELAGASESRIVVRDLPAGSTSTGSGTPERGSDPGTQLGTGSGRSHDQHAGTRADNPATDGMNDGTTRHSRTIRGVEGATQPRSIEPVTDTRSAGVDVTM